MYRRHWSALPRDVSFPSNLKDLGYFVNDKDEIRSIEDPNFYFNFFINKNERINKRQRFEFDRAVGRIIHQRLCGEGLTKISLPLQAQPGEPHVPVFSSDDLAAKARVILIFGEHTKALGLLATRVTGGRGGINRGSMVSVVQAIQHLNDESGSVGVILASMGQLYWWHASKESLTVSESSEVPLPSLVHMGTKYVAELNDIPGSEDPSKHMQSIFEQIVAKQCKPDVKLDVIAIGESCETVVRFFDNEDRWGSWGSSLSALLFFSPTLTSEDFTNKDFESFLAKRARGYIISDEPLDTPLLGPAGNPSQGIPPLGFPCYASGEFQLSEIAFIKALHAGLAYLQEVSKNPGYENPYVTVIERPTIEEAEDSWAKLPDQEKPNIATYDESSIMKEVRILRRWRKFETTGVAPDSDSYSDED